MGRRSALLGVMASLIGVCVHADTPCERLRVPPASIQHVMVHVDSFNGVHEQAKKFASYWNVPSFKAVELTRQLMDAMEDMALYHASEAMVNLTLDHTLTYAVEFEDPLDHSHTVTKEIHFTAEQPVMETIEMFAKENLLSDTFSERLEPQLRPFLVRDWGCETNETTTKPEGAPPARPKEPVLRIKRNPSMPVLNINVGGEKKLLTVSADQELELQATVICQELTTSLEDCLRLLDAMHNITRAHPSFVKPLRNRTSAKTEIQLYLSSPAPERLYPISERMYLDGEWWNMTTGDVVPGRYNVCVYLDLSSLPAFCGTLPALEHNVYFFRPFDLDVGHHTILVSKQPISSPSKDGEDDDEDDGDEDGNGDEKPTEYIAARHFWIVTPTVELKQVSLTEVNESYLLDLQIQTTAMDLNDTDARVCVLLDAALDCIQSQRLVVEDKTGIRDQTITVFRARVFGVGRGKHTLSVLLVNSLMKSFASTTPLDINVELTTDQRLVPRDEKLFYEPPLPTHNQKPSHCPSVLPTAGLGWICDLWRREWGRYSQNGEDGVLQSLFHHIGTTNRAFVEFGTENGAECNTRYLREVQNWRGLLMDGRFENAAINLHKEWISPENINDLFTKYDVPSEFDLLSIDVDFNDYWILDAIDRTRFSSRVIVIEINSHIPPDEARVVKYKGPASMWDQESLFFGVSVGAMHLWGKRNGYSLVYCESRGVNCFLVRDDVLASVTDDGSESLVVSDVLGARDLHNPPNFFSKGLRYFPPTPESGVVEEWEWLE